MKMSSNDSSQYKWLEFRAGEAREAEKRPPKFPTMAVLLGVAGAIWGITFGVSSIRNTVRALDRYKRGEHEPLL
jgi:hypothetical protein